MESDINIDIEEGDTRLVEVEVWNTLRLLPMSSSVGCRDNSDQFTQSKFVLPNYFYIHAEFQTILATTCINIFIALFSLILEHYH